MKAEKIKMLVGFVWITAVLVLMFFNWHAAIAMMLFQITLNTGRTAQHTAQAKRLNIFGAN